ncbi:unnamed protein product, partial [Ceratitis capitata]
YPPQITTYHQTTPYNQTKPYHQMSQNYFNKQPIGQNQYSRPQYQQYQQNFQPQRPNGPKLQPKPIPMGIDHSQQIDPTSKDLQEKDHHHHLTK